MQFGIFDHIERRRDVDLAQQYEERLQLVARADEAGFYGYHVAEHHHSPLCLAANQAVYFAAVAQRTRWLRFGPLVYVLPLHHPVRLIEEICMVDNLSDGRYQVGVGPGTGAPSIGPGTEFAMWGGDPADNRARFEETLAILRLGLQSPFLTFHGAYFDFHDLWMELRPKQQPHPPFWYAGNPESAARRGMNFIGRAAIPAMTDAVRRYRSLWSDTSNDDPTVRRPAAPLVGGSMHLFVADSDAEARERAATAWEDYRTHFAKPTPPSAATAAGEGLNETTRRALHNRDEANAFERVGGPGSIDAAAAVQAQRLLAGSPATVREHVRTYAETTGANYFVGAFQWGDLTHREALRSLELFAAEVMPAIAGAATR